MSRYFHTDSADVLALLAERITHADLHEQRFRIDVDALGTLRFKVGEGMWSHPIASTPDPYRDGA